VVYTTETCKLYNSIVSNFRWIVYKRLRSAAFECRSYCHSHWSRLKI